MPVFNGYPSLNEESTFRRRKHSNICVTKNYSVRSFSINRWNNRNRGSINLTLELANAVKQHSKILSVVTNIAKRPSKYQLHQSILLTKYCSILMVYYKAKGRYFSFQAHNIINSPDKRPEHTVGEFIRFTLIWVKIKKNVLINTRPKILLLPAICQFCFLFCFLLNNWYF